MDGKGQTSGKKRGPAPLWAGELIVQNGRQSGARRPLAVPLTIVGKDPGCDVRLNSSGIDPLHCLLVHGPSGLMLRDLDSANGTFVNGERASSVNLKDGDLLTIGGFEFRLHLPPRSFAISDQPASQTVPDFTPSDQDALRLQAAAVAAQQVALGEEEVRLVQRKTALERQEEQLAGHLEDKRRKILELHERAKAERRSLQQDRVAYEEHVARIAGDLSHTQREVLDQQEQLLTTRKRLAELYHRLRHRLGRQREAERDLLVRREEDLARRARELDQENRRLQELAQSLNQQQMEVNGEVVAGRNHIQTAWQRLRQAQIRWRQRRAAEWQVLRQRANEQETAQNMLAEGQRQFNLEKQDWDRNRRNLDREVDGLEKRVRNQRHKIIQHQLEINRLDNIARQRQESQDESTALVPMANPAARAAGKGKPGKANRPGTAPVMVEVIASAPAGQLTAEQGARLRDWDQEIQRRVGLLERLAGDLADQRVLLLEQWQRLVQTQQQWENQRGLAANDLEGLTIRLQEQEHALSQREQLYEQAEHQFRLRHRELTHLRQHLVAWRSRLKTRENALECERDQLLTEVHNREDLVEKHLGILVDLRRRWARRRRQELSHLQADNEALARLQKECGVVREELVARAAALDEEKRAFADKSLALEECKQEFLLRMDNPGAERRLDRLERRWATQNAAAGREVAQQREALQAEMAAVQGRYNELLKRQQTIAQAEYDLANKQTGFEHQEALAVVRNTRLEQEKQGADAQLQLLEQQLIRMKEEVERIARQLIDEPEPEPQAVETEAPMMHEEDEPEALVNQAA